MKNRSLVIIIFALLAVTSSLIYHAYVTAYTPVSMVPKDITCHCSEQCLDFVALNGAIEFNFLVPEMKTSGCYSLYNLDKEELNCCVCFTRI